MVTPNQNPADFQREFRTAQQDIDNTRIDIDVLQSKLDKLQQDFEVLQGKFRYPGTKFLVDLEYRLLYEGTLTVPASSAISSAVIETLPGALHAVYSLSAHCMQSSVALICDGSAPALVGLHVHLLRSRSLDPIRIDVTARVQNTTSTEHTVAIRVWRRLGIGS